jgi:hypothetical protein
VRNDDVKKNYYLSDYITSANLLSILHATYVETEKPCPLFHIVL